LWIDEREPEAYLLDAQTERTTVTSISLYWQFAPETVKALIGLDPFTLPCWIKT
jgi:hypothetical protein